MASSINSISVKGIRSFGPNKQDKQIIELYPLTLILGQNGTGKTTIIEALKFITSGQEPPFSDCRRNFVHDPRISKSRQVNASIEMEFTSVGNKSGKASRNIKYESLSKNTPTITSFYDIAGNSHSVNKQDEWGKTMAKLIGVPNLAVLNHVIFCHQDQSNWCLSDASEVKQKFDDIFGCQAYKKALKYLKDYRKKIKSDLDMAYVQLGQAETIVKDKERVLGLLNQYRQKKDMLVNDISALKLKLESAKSDIELLRKEKCSIDSIVHEKNKVEQGLEYYEKDINRFKMELGENLMPETEVSDEKVQEKYDQFEVSLSNQRQQLNEQEIIELQLNRERLAISNEISRIERDVKTFEIKEGILKVEYETLSESFKDAGVELLSGEEENLNIKVDILKQREDMCRDQNETNKSVEDTRGRDLQNVSDEYRDCKQKIQMKKQELKQKSKTIDDFTNILSNGHDSFKSLQHVVDNLDEMKTTTSIMAERELALKLNNLIDRSRDILRGSLESSNMKETKLTEQIKKLTLEAQLCERTIADLETRLPDLKNDVEVADKLLSQAKEQLKSSSNQLNNLLRSHQDLKSKVIRFNRSKEELLGANLLDKRITVESKRKDLAGIEIKFTDSASTIRDLTRDLENAKSRFNIIRENKSLRDQKSKYNDLKAKLNGFVLQLSNSKPIESITAQLEEKERYRFEISESKSKNEGEKSALQQNINSTEKFLAENIKYKVAYRKYSEFLGEKVILELLIKDIDLLYECLDSSVTQFHHEILRSINYALDLRWRQVYKGDDVETIKLVADEETKGATADKRKYNYHIAMVRGGVQMRMRERSSAGQKVLASIIVRIALAELFAQDLGILAFDEPTCNLDIENVKSLARTISGLVKNRIKKGHNIKWIIISHDEEFLKALDPQCSPYFYRISRDDGGNSRIAKHSIESLELSNT